MKVLIWFLCIFANALITVLAKENGIILGAIPTIVLFGGMFWLATALCKAWDKRHEDDRENRILEREKAEEAAREQVRFCRKCGEKLLDGSKFCRICGTELIEEPDANVYSIDDCEFCKKCGADTSNDTGVCHVCGELKNTN